MRPLAIGLLVLLLPGVSPLRLLGQEDPPPGLAEVELARSRSCVGTLARLADFNATLEPLARRLARLNALGRAVSLEKAAEASPFDTGDPLEEAVAGWFSADSALAARYLEARDSSLLQERSGNREAILARIDEAIQQQMAEGQERSAEGAPLQAEARPCESAIFVRDAVLEECASTESPLCDLARAPEEAEGPGRFVDTPESLWYVEQFRPWTEPAPLQRNPEGGLTGARTGAQARRGNVIFSLRLAPLLQQRSNLSEDAVQLSLANLDSLGITFDHPSFTMAPGLELVAQLPAPLGGETHYLLHFGDLSGDDVIWTLEAGGPRRVQLSFPITERQLARLEAGEPVSLTALRIPTGEEAETEAEAVFTLSLLQVGQAPNVSALLEYMRNGSLSRDLRRLIPPASGG